ncbi:MAG: hypothetical protein KDD69_05960, partial [Bdellovibrionales bacterium]|nr:hypothetical protein [Bdellovibrionales bacterium]
MQMENHFSVEGGNSFSVWDGRSFRNTHQKLIKLQDENSGIEQNTFYNSGFRRKFVEVTGKEATVEATVKRLWGTTSKNKPNWPEHWTGTSLRYRAEKLGPIYE